MRRPSAILALTLSLCFAGFPEVRPCSDSDARRAFNEADTYRDWDAFYKAFNSYWQCDDGAIGEGYSESTARILVDHWNTLPRLARLAKEHPNFRRFVLGHVDETLDLADLEKIRAKAKGNCPVGLRTLCDDLAKSAAFSPKEGVPAQDKK